MSNLSILLQAAGGGAMQQMVMILMIIVVFYFFMIRPQMKKAKLEKAFKESIKKGDKVVTIGGVHGKILEVQDKTQETETPLGQVPHFGRSLELCMDICYFVLWSSCSSACLR